MERKRLVKITPGGMAMRLIPGVMGKKR